MVSVSATAIAFLTLGYFFKIKEIKSPEMTEVRSEAVLEVPAHLGREVAVQNQLLPVEMYGKWGVLCLKGWPLHGVLISKHR